MPGKDETRWQSVEGDHADDVTYGRVLAAPGTVATDEARTAEEISATAEAAVEGINATDGAIEAANELGVDLATVTGTGADGRITKADVEAAANA
jgi:pyruvate/2-oxoglutarate dehydrogenase complex dihydrolipoamide acyltransferase (E2) component